MSFFFLLHPPTVSWLPAPGAGDENIDPMEFLRRKKKREELDRQELQDIMAILSFLDGS